MPTTQRLPDGSRLVWYENEVMKALDAKLYRKLARAGELVKNEVVRSISVPTRSAGPSLPGDPPHMDSGMLRKSIVWKIAKLGREWVVYVGSPLRYALHLELGVSRMAARPFLRPAVYRCMDAIKRIFKDGR